MQVILAVVEGAQTDRSVLRVAELAAKDAEVHIDVLSSLPDPRDSIPVVGEGLSGDVVERLMQEAAEEIEKLRTRSRAAYDELLAGSGMREASIADGQQGSSLSWREVTGRSADVVPAEGRVADLVVVARATSEREDRGTVEATVFGSGRPVLMAPPEPVVSLGKSIAVFWNGSTEAARAVAAALPYLRKAERVTLMALDEHLGPDGGRPGLERYLAWHGVALEIQVIKPDYRDPGDALLEEARNAGADLIVMGAYTHSRLRQMILGGVTSHMLENSTVPVLMCH